MEVKVEALSRKIEISDSGNRLEFSLDGDKRTEDIDWGGDMGSFVSGNLDEILELSDMDFDICVNILREARKQYDL